MVITLEIVTPDGTAFRKELGPAGGMIGRQKGCDVYLPDPDRQVSREHARISFRNGEFYVEDLSTGGLSINSLANRIPQHQPHLLKSQDLLIIEPYKIRVVAVEGRSPIGDSLVPTSVDMGGPLPLDDLFPVSRPPSAATPREPTRGSVLSEHQPRPVVTPAGRPAAAVPSSPTAQVDIPSDYDFVNDRWAPGCEPQPDRQTPAVEAPVQGDRRPREEPRESGTWVNLDEVLRAAGLQALPIGPEVAEEFGRILHVVVEGIIQLLRARQEIKGEFRMDRTRFRPRGNNPLKFSVDADDALHNLLVKKNEKYLAPVDAFRDALDDLAIHQEAVLAGVRVAFDTLLKGLEPERLQKEFDPLAKKNVLLELQTKARYWDMYCDKIRGMLRDLESTYRELFEDGFASAYEAEFRRRKSGGPETGG